MVLPIVPTMRDVERPSNPSHHGLAAAFHSAACCWKRM